MDASENQQYDNSTYFKVVQSAVPGIDAGKLDAFRHLITDSGADLQALVGKIKPP